MTAIWPQFYYSRRGYGREEDAGLLISFWESTVLPPVGIAARERCKTQHKGQANRFVGVDLSKQNCYVSIIIRYAMIVVH
ncbi:MAG: hypothetical protein ACOWWR_16575 [Eubacteriales bacterium]